MRFLSDERLHQLAAAGRSFVLLDRLVPGLEARCVTFDHRRASQMATQVLIDAGHRHIACISGSAQRHSSELRRQGFIDAMQLAGLEPVACVEGVYDLESGYQRADEILKRPQHPTAIYCCNEEMATGALLAINKHHLQVPQDISLLCYDSGERAPFVSPALTSLHFPIVEMSRYATQLRINPLIPSASFPPAIIMRESVMPPKK